MPPRCSPTPLPRVPAYCGCPDIGPERRDFLGYVGCRDWSQEGIEALHGEEKRGKIILA